MILIRVKNVEKKIEYLLLMFSLTVFCNPVIINIQNGMEVFGTSIANKLEKNFYLKQIHIFYPVQNIIVLNINIIFS